MIGEDKIVNFGQYCSTCEHFDLAEEEDPCYYCLGHFTNENSHKPVYYKENKNLPKIAKKS